MSAHHDSDKHQRRSIRLQGFDYAQEGAYFVTICVHNRTCLFGDVLDNRMQLNDAGQIAKECWRAIPGHFRHVELDAFVIMPNHSHGILCIGDDAFVANTGAYTVGAKNFSPLPPGASAFRSPSKTVGSIVRGFKIGVTKWIRANTDIHEVWQRNYYEHIIRDDAALNQIRQYIIENPARWSEDTENPARLSHKGKKP